MSSLRTILDSLASHVSGLKEEGGRLVEVGAAWSKRASAPAAARVSPSPPAAPRPPAAPVKAVTANIVWHPLCHVSGSSNDKLLLVTRDSELTGEAGTLLRAMLSAIGFALEGEPSPLVKGDEAKGKAACLLCLGEEAFERIDPIGMGMKMARGKWLMTTSGRALASFAPSYLLGYPAGKKTSWADLQAVLKELGLPLPVRS